MRIYSSITWDMSRPLPDGKFEAVSATYEEYTGPVSECKGDSTAKAAEKNQLTFNKQLQGLFTQQFQNQQGVLNFLKGKLEPMIQNPTGYSPQALATMRTSASDTNAEQFRNASKALNTRLTARQGATSLPSGVDAQLQAGLNEAGAQTESGSQNQITMQNENLKQSNLWNAINVLNGTSAQFNPLGYAGEATGAAGSIAGLSKANTQAENSGFWGNFKNSLGSALGKTLGGGNMAGNGGGASSTAAWFCWIAAEVFGGWLDSRTILVRKWLRLEYSKSIKGKLMLALYIIFGRPAAYAVRKSTRVRHLFESIFNEALKRARAWEASINPSKEIK